MLKKLENVYDSVDNIPPELRETVRDIIICSIGDYPAQNTLVHINLEDIEADLEEEDDIYRKGIQVLRDLGFPNEFYLYWWW